MSSGKIDVRSPAFPLLFLVASIFIGASLPRVSSQNSTSIEQIFQYDSYRETCPDAEKIVWSKMADIVSGNENATAQLLRLLFHDCFIQGCDASVMLNDTMGMPNQTTERHADPNKTLKGFDFVEEIKELVESECPGVVSCADILVLATRDAIALSGGPYYPAFTGRKDSTRYYTAEATEEIPRPNSNISETLRLFAQRGFNERETVALLGSHNIGRINCGFIASRINMFDNGAIPLDFLRKMRTTCQVPTSSMRNSENKLKVKRVYETSRSMQYYEGLSSSSGQLPGGGFGNHYYQALLKGKGILTADQELMANEQTAKAVFEYAEDADKFRFDFAGAMMKLSNLNVLVGPAGEVRRICSSVNSS
ncbi:peroxidase 57 [Striga asiatica]|uniref:Peroxidase n=1 Tax=Striga asiatica TaxID=4170 RepID=A0A5A7PY20_STRAF|nr:peroxidase 57 [Striga asiatica]